MQIIEGRDFVGRKFVFAKVEKIRLKEFKRTIRYVLHCIFRQFQR